MLTGPVRRHGLLVAATLAALACARIEPPPGGPPDAKAPTLAGTRPDSLISIPGFKGSAEFIFNEVISEGSSPSEGLGTGDLERLVLLSPTKQVPIVEWKRNRIAVRPREGWQPDRVYRVQLLPGVADVRSNRGTQSRTITFTTGAPLPDLTLRGKAYDWTTGQAARGALLEAVLEPDSLVYKGATDSTGNFSLGPLPRGQYVVYATIDQNRNLRRDRRETFDSARVVGDSGTVPELWLFPHDTAPPKLQPPTVQDSLTVLLPFNQKLDPTQRLDTSAVSLLRMPDSAHVALRSLLPAPVDDSLQRIVRAARDSAIRDSVARDTTAKRDTMPRPVPPPVAKPDTAKGRAPAAPPLKPVPDSAKAAISKLDSALAGRRADSARVTKPSRPPLNDRLVLRLAEPLVPGGKYSVEVRGVRNVNGAEGDSRTGFTVQERPKPTAIDTTKTGDKKPGAGRARPDSSAPARVKPKPSD